MIWSTANARTVPYIHPASNMPLKRQRRVSSRPSCAQETRTPWIVLDKNTCKLGADRCNVETAEMRIVNALRVKMADYRLYLLGSTPDSDACS